MDKKSIVFGVVSLTFAIVALGMVAANVAGYHLSFNELGVSTSNGPLTLLPGTEIGGSYTNFITLTQGVTLQTTSGSQYFASGTEINCDHELGEPDPCELIT